MTWECVIGLEVHVQLGTNTKMFWCVFPSFLPARNCPDTRMGNDPTAVIRMASL